MKTIKFKLYSTLVGGILLTSLGLFLFIQHYNKTTSDFLILVGLINYAVFLVLFFYYRNSLKKTN